MKTGLGTSLLPLTVETRLSPNFGQRPSGRSWPDSIVLHYTGMADGPSAVDWLCNPVSQVSCHYVVMEDGCILRLVAEEHRAWHAGRSSWAGVTDMNSASIGIEVVNAGHDFGLPDYPEEQIGSLMALCTDIAVRHAIRPERMLAHSDIAPSRKRDPGERFPWERLHRAGLGHWVPPATDEAGLTLGAGDRGAEVAIFQSALAGYGFGIAETGVFDPDTEIVVRAFQRHFRPARIDGRADAGTRKTLDRLIETLPA